MTFAITYPAKGRGSFDTGAILGGTLNASGVVAGPFYRAPASGSVMKMPGATARNATRAGTPCSINDYAVFKAVMSMQSAFSVETDGVFGNDTMAGAKRFQESKGLTQDGIVGKDTSKAILLPLIIAAAIRQDSAHADMLRRVSVGTVAWESGFDLGAVGILTPDDLGPGQINDVHGLSEDFRLNPYRAVPWLVEFIDINIRALGYDLDGGIAAYNLGVTGAKKWVAAGRPQKWGSTDVWAYIANIKRLGWIP